MSSLSACATITRGTSQKLEISSVPPGADVELSTGQTCTTPCTLNLKRKTPFTATLKKDGYQTATADVKSTFTGGAPLLGNIIFGGLIGMVVDATNGSLKSLRPGPLEVTLVPADGSAPAPAAATQN